jgi:hypothetical protein
VNTIRNILSSIKDGNLLIGWTGISFSRSVINTLSPQFSGMLNTAEAAACCEIWGPPSGVAEDSVFWLVMLYKVVNSYRRFIFIIKQSWFAWTWRWRHFDC